jgi:hypothetical protein
MYVIAMVRRDCEVFAGGETKNTSSLVRRYENIASKLVLIRQSSLARKCPLPIDRYICNALDASYDQEGI